MALMLAVDRITIAFGGVTALQEVSLAIESGSVAGLIGPNGSGKTTLFNCICGYYRPQSGRVLLEGNEITHLPPHEVARRGIGRTFQMPNLFRDLSLSANFALAAENMAIGGSVTGGLLTSRRKHGAEVAKAMLATLELEHYADFSPAEIPVGLAKLGDLGRALSTRPRLLLLDEPAVGLNDAERARLARLLRKLVQDHCLTLLIVDHNIGFVSSLCEQITVLASGRVLSCCTPDQVRADPAVIEA